MAERHRVRAGGWAAIGLGLGLMAGLVGAGLADDDVEVVGITTHEQDSGPMLIHRVWSNGVIEVARWTRTTPAQRIERWEVVSGVAVYPGL